MNRKYRKTIIAGNWKMNMRPSEVKAFADAHVQSQMASGSVTRKEQILREAGGCRILEGKYACIEDIGICKDEKIGEFHGKADGTDRERGSGG